MSSGTPENDNEPIEPLTGDELNRVSIEISGIDREVAGLETKKRELLGSTAKRIREHGVPPDAEIATLVLLGYNHLGHEQQVQALRFLTELDLQLKAAPGQMIAWIDHEDEASHSFNPAMQETDLIPYLKLGLLPGDAHLTISRFGSMHVEVGSNVKIKLIPNVAIEEEGIDALLRAANLLSNSVDIHEHVRLPIDKRTIFGPKSIIVGNEKIADLFGRNDLEGQPEIDTALYALRSML